ncbi:hypothetical protein CLU96_1291 [Chryseobacterium sp. 52]|nr:hypothetical protein CLU96_1291 [Chryseobacterium sp. 52]
MTLILIVIPVGFFFAEYFLRKEYQFESSQKLYFMKYKVKQAPCSSIDTNKKSNSYIYSSDLMLND